MHYSTSGAGGFPGGLRLLREDARLSKLRYGRAHRARVRGDRIAAMNCLLDAETLFPRFGSRPNSQPNRSISLRFEGDR